MVPPQPAPGFGFPTALLIAGGQLYIAGNIGLLRVDVSTGLIYIVAGVVTSSGFNGDGAVASATFFNSLSGMAADAQGNLFLADAGNNRVRKIATGSQIVTTVAGGYIGDGRQATNAALNFNFGGHFAFDARGNFYIADTYDQRVRKVSPTGSISTFAGTGLIGYTGDNGPAIAAQLSGPTSVAVDASGNVYIVDHGNGVLRRVDPTGVITTVQVHPPPFTPFSLFGGILASLAIDSGGNIYVSDGLAAVWKIDPSGNATIVAGQPFSLGYGGDGGLATQAFLLFPSGIAIDKAGNLYIADWLNQRIRKVDTAGIITTFAGTGSQGFSGDGGPATSAQLGSPLDVALDAAGNLLIADWANDRIREVDTTGTIHTIAGSGGFGYNGEGLPPSQANMFPTGIGFSPSGRLYFADWGGYLIRQIRK